MSRWKVAVVGLAALALPFSSKSSGQSAVPLAFSQINQPGFGNRQVNYAWSMAMFQGKIFVGVNKNFRCLQAAEIFYLTNQGFYPPYFSDCVQCAPNYNNLDLRGEIWSYTPLTHAWTRVYQSPLVPNPAVPGQTFAEDIGYRGMIVYTETDGTQALYVGGVTARDLIPALPGPRILRSTDGVTFTPIPFSASANTPNIVGFRGMQAINGQLAVIGTTNLDGYGVVLGSPTPSAGNFTLLSPPSISVYEMHVFNNHLYLGTADATNGYSVLRLGMTGTPPYSTTTVVCCGGGVGPAEAVSVVAMQVFNNRLYVSSAPSQSKSQSIGASTNYAAELIRIAPDDSWQLVVGTPRRDPITGHMLTPLSGLGDGFGNPYNNYIWSMEVHNGLLYLGTFDSSGYEPEATNLIPGRAAQYGFDLFSTPDGVNMTEITHNGLNVPNNFGARTMVSTVYGLFLGSANDCDGTGVFLGLQPPPSGGRGGSSGGGTPSVFAPARLGGETSGSSAVLSWEAPAGASKFQVYRTTSKLVDSPTRPGRKSWVAGPTEWVGTSDADHFEAPAPLAGERSTYFVRSEDAKGKLSGPSNGIQVTSATQAVTIEGILSDVRGLAARRRVDAKGAEALTSALEAAAKSVDAGDLASARSQLEALTGRIKGGEAGLNPAAAEDLADRVGSLLRRVRLADAGVLPAGSLLANP